LIKVNEGGVGWGRIGGAIEAVDHEEGRGVDHDEDGPLRVVALDHDLDGAVGREQIGGGGQEGAGDIAHGGLGLGAQIDKYDAAAVEAEGAGAGAEQGGVEGAHGRLANRHGGDGGIAQEGAHGGERLVIARVVGGAALDPGPEADVAEVGEGLGEPIGRGGLDRAARLPAGGPRCRAASTGVRRHIKCARCALGSAENVTLCAPKRRDCVIDVGSCLPIPAPPRLGAYVPSSCGLYAPKNALVKTVHTI